MLIALLLTACSVTQPAPTPVPPTSAPPTAIPPTPAPPTPAPPTPVPPRQAPAAVPALNPSPRGYVAVAYDQESDRVILYGGQTGNIMSNPDLVSGETWAYDVAANKWTNMKPASGPGDRGAADLAYDTKSDRVILFGGANKRLWGLGDMWAYDFNTNSWRQMADGPSGYLGCRIAYDAESDRVILFGGYLVSGGRYINKTWAYDYNSDTWTEMNPSASPRARNFHAMAYDAESDRVIMWGGDAGGDVDAWAYDYNTNTWQQMVSREGPTSRDYMSIVYSAKADRIILYGGSENGNDETWAYDYNANRWTKLAPATNAGLRSQYALAYSAAADRVIMFGGAKGARFIYSEETWVYDLKANTWTNLTTHP